MNNDHLQPSHGRASCGKFSGYRGIKRRVYDVIQPGVHGSVLSVVFDVVVMLLIIASVVIVFAVTFDLPPRTMECLKNVEKGIVDLLAILPSLLPLILPEGMLGIRALRLIRLLRIFKLNRHFDALAAIRRVIESKAKDLLAVLFFMSLIVLFLSLLLFAAEHDAQPDKFRNAVSALWWAFGTFTKAGTHGFAPITTSGRIIGAIISVLGICLIAIPTGIISSGLIEHLKHRQDASNGSSGDGRRHWRNQTGGRE